MSKLDELRRLAQHDVECWLAGGLHAKVDSGESFRYGWHAGHARAEEEREKAEIDARHAVSQ